MGCSYGYNVRLGPAKAIYRHLPLGHRYHSLYSNPVYRDGKLCFAAHMCAIYFDKDCATPKYTTRILRIPVGRCNTGTSVVVSKDYRMSALDSIQTARWQPPFVTTSSITMRRKCLVMQNSKTEIRAA